MKLIELFEQEDFASFTESAEIIVRDCEPWLKSLPGLDYLIWRGARRAPKQIGFVEKIATHANRMSVDSGASLHNRLDAFFDEKFGIKFRSSNIVFGSGSPVIASNYGTTGVIYPIGNFKCCWSPDIEDLFTYVRGIIVEYFSNVNDKDEKLYLATLIAGTDGHTHIDEIKENDPDLYEWIMELMQENDWSEYINPEFIDRFIDTMTDEKFARDFDLNTYRLDHLRQYFQNAESNEIMIQCKEYYMINLNKDKYKDEWIQALQKAYKK